VSCIASRNGAPADAWRVDCDANRNLLDAARRGGARHFVLLSAICVQRPRLAFQHAKLAFEAALKESGITYSIVRPTAFFKSLAGQIDRVQAGRPFLVFGDGCATACKPISEADLASFIVNCLEDPALANRVLPDWWSGTRDHPARARRASVQAGGSSDANPSAISPKLFDAGHRRARAAVAHHSVARSQGRIRAHRPLLRDRIHAALGRGAQSLRRGRHTELWQ
jgi:nucleoside-diphosphate-sugar epimerase